MEKLNDPVPGPIDKGSMDDSNKENDKQKENSPAKKKVKITKKVAPYRGRRASQELRDCKKGLYSPPASPACKTSLETVKEVEPQSEKVGCFCRFRYNRKPHLSHIFMVKRRLNGE